MPLNPETRRSSTVTPLGSDTGYAVTFVTRYHGEELVRFGAIYGRRDDIRAALLDWEAGMSEKEFCAKHRARPFTQERK